MTFEFVIDGDYTNVSTSDLILSLFFRVHFNGGSDLGRGNCECGDKQIYRFGDSKP